MSNLDTSIRLAEFQTMTEEERKIRVDALFQSAISPTPEQALFSIQKTDKEIQQYELKYEMSSDQMLESLESDGRASGFPEVCSWLMALRRRESWAQWISKVNSI
ncbi:MAG: hypothetical protein PUP93_31205 [Rhizonema sp. NSF051]|nr:hypothetical protein [Rhizonema sp. NSF051]